MTTSTIKLFLPFGDPSELRIAEISNWSGKAIACPRTSLAQLYQRSELDQPGVYLLLGEDSESGNPTVYIGEAETLRTRLPDHRKREFWSQVIVIFSKDDFLSKSHIKYLEGRLISIATEIGKADLDNNQESGAKLSESDTADMEVFLLNLLQLLPVLGTSAFQKSQTSSHTESQVLIGRLKGLQATGNLTANGFVVYEGSRAVSELRPSEKEDTRATSAKLRSRLLENGTLIPSETEEGALVFSKDHEFSSPSAAGSVICGGATNGLTFWKSSEGKILKDLL